jgi:uncharacterized membrane-anchored protein YhcB (DUF1043 family)
MVYRHKGASKAVVLLAVVAGALFLLACAAAYKWYESTQRERTFKTELDQQRTNLAARTSDDKVLQNLLTQNQATQAALSTALNKLIELEQKRGQPIPPPPAPSTEPIKLPPKDDPKDVDPTQPPPAAAPQTQDKVEPVSPDKPSAEEQKGDLGAVAMGAALAACVAVPPSCAAFLGLASLFGSLSFGEQQTILKVLQSVALNQQPSQGDLTKLSDIVAKHPDLVAKVQAAAGSSDQYRKLGQYLVDARTSLIQDAEKFAKDHPVPTESIEKCKTEIVGVVGSSKVDRFKYEAIRRRLNEKGAELATQCIGMLSPTGQ